MKLPALLSQYLREQKTLSLPGIGIFHLTGSLPSENEASTQHSSQVQFESKRIREADDKLINFIKQETGKIKPLAIADLESFIATGMELLNMGKPFELDGIGNIQKTSDFDGNQSYNFQPNIGLGIRLKNFSIDYALTNIGNQSDAIYSNVFSIRLDFEKKK